MSRITEISYGSGHVPQTLTGEKDWRRAIERQKIGRHTMVTVYRADAPPSVVPAENVAELKAIFEQLYPSEPPPAPPQPVEPKQVTNSIWTETRSAPPPPDLSASTESATGFPDDDRQPEARPEGVDPWLPPQPPETGNAPLVRFLAVASIALVLVVVILLIALSNRPRSGVPGYASNSTTTTTTNTAALAMTSDSGRSMSMNSADALQNSTVSETLSNASTDSEEVTAEDSEPERYDLQGRAETLVGTYYSTWSPSNNTDWMPGAYVSNPSYYRSTYAVSQIQEKQLGLFRNYPSRSFAIVPNSMATTCDVNNQSCTTTGSVNIRYSNSAQVMTVTARFVFRTISQGDRMVIVSEDGSLLQCNGKAPPPDHRPCSPSW